MEDFNKQLEKMIYLNVNQTPEEKVLTLKDNIFSTITNSNFLNVYDKKSYEKLCEIIKTNDNILVASLPIFRFSEDGKNDDTTKAFSFSLGIVNNDYEHGKYELLTVDEIKEYLNKEVWILLYSLSDESYENTPFKWKTIILNKKSSKVEGNATEKEIELDINKFYHVFVDDKFKNKYVKKWIDAGLVDNSKSDEEKYHLTTYLTIAEDLLNKDNDENKEYQVVVYPIIVRLNDKLFLRNQSIPQLIKDIKEEFYKCKKVYQVDINNIDNSVIEIKNKIEADDFELKFIETFVDNYCKKFERKHLSVLCEALKKGEPNDQTKLIAGLSQLKTAGFKDYEGLDKDWLFSDYYPKYDISLTKEEKEKKNEEAYQYFIEKNIKCAENDKAMNKIDKMLDYISEFYDNKNPYPLMLFSETFEVKDIPKNDIGLTDKYLTAINHPVILELQKIYEKYKIYTLLSNPNNYFIAKQHQLIDYLINFYELNDFIKIDSQKCHHVANLILNKMGDKFDARLFMEKYVKARTYEIIKEFETFFVQQFLEFMNITPTIKLF